MSDAVVKERETQVEHQYKNRNLYPTIVDVCSISCVKKSLFFRSSIDRLRGNIFSIAIHLRASAHDGLKCEYHGNYTVHMCTDAMGHVVLGNFLQDYNHSN